MTGGASRETASAPLAQARLGHELVAQGLIDQAQLDVCEEELRQAAEEGGAPPHQIQVQLRSRLIRAEQLVALLGQEREERKAGAPTPADTAAPDVGGYPITGRLGQGGMGEVLQVWDRNLGRHVAAKRVRADTDVQQLRRLVREAQITGQLEHPNIVPIHELGVDPDGEFYFTMKRVAGRDLDSLLWSPETGEASSPEGPTAGEQSLMHLLQIFLRICDAIAFAHSKGVIHRDLKPSNVMVGRFGEVLVMDWGLAKRVGEADPDTRELPRPEPALAEQSTLETIEGSVLGTPTYMSPEQARGELATLDQRTDVYALGAMLYQILTLRPPYIGQEVQLVLAQVIAGKLVPPSRITSRPVPWELEAVVLRAMAHHREDRYESAEALRADIERFLEGRVLAGVRYGALRRLGKWLARHRWQLAGVALLLLTVLGTLGVRRWQRWREIPELLAGADAELGAGEYRRAEDLYERVLAIDSRSGHARSGRALAARRARQRDAEIQVAQEWRAAREAFGHARAVAREFLEGLARADGSEDSRELSARRGEGALSKLLRATSQLDRVAKSEHAPPGAQRLRLRSGRLLGDVALAMRDYTLARHAYSQLGASGMSAEGVAALVRKVVEARDRVLTRRRARIEGILNEIRIGLKDRAGLRPTERFDEHVDLVSSYRDEQTITLLERALKPLVSKARAEGVGASWSPTERMLAGFACRVLGRLGGERAAAVLATWGSAVREHSMMVEVSTALCRTRHPAAFWALWRLRHRLGLLSDVVQRKIDRLLPLIPAPRDDSRWAPRSQDQLFARSAQHMRRQEYQASLRDLERLLSEQGLSGKLRRMSLMRKAHVLDCLGRVAESKELLRTLEATGGERYAKLLTRARVHAHNKEYREALQVADQLVREFPGKSMPYGLRGQVRHALGDVPGAVADLEKGLALGFDTITATVLGGLYLSQRRTDEAIKLLERAIELDPTSSKAHGLLGQCMVMAGRLGRAANLLDRALVLDPRNFRAYRWRGLLRSNQGRHRQALTDFLMVQRLRPGRVASYDLGLIYFQLSEYQRALKAFRETFRDGPWAGDWFCWMYIGRCQEKLGQPAKVWRASYQKAYDLAPEVKRKQYRQHLDRRLPR